MTGGCAAGDFLLGDQLAGDDGALSGAKRGGLVPKLSGSESREKGGCRAAAGPGEADGKGGVLT